VLFRKARNFGRRVINRLRRNPGQPPNTAPSKIIDWKATLGADYDSWLRLRKDAAGKKVLVATGTGGHAAVLALESLVGVSLAARGAKVEFLLCDETLPACLMCLATDTPNVETFVEKGPQGTQCGTCYKPARAILEELQFPIHTYGSLLSPEDRAEAKRVTNSVPVGEISRFELEGLAVGEHAMAGALRYYARATLEGERYGEAILRRYFEASLLTAFAILRLLDEGKFDVAVFHHGIYVPQGIVGEVCRQKGVRVVNWSAAYRKKCFIFSHGNTYHHTLMTEPLDRWEDLDLNPEVETKIMDYLKSRWDGTQDWIYFHEKPDFNLSNIANEIGLDLKKPTIGMLTNVMWDAQLHYPANAFPNMLEWVLSTIRYFATRTELQLVIRVHPAEIRGTVPSRQPLMDEIKKAFPQVPANVFIIPPESRISTYVAMGICDSVLIFGTKTGVELTSMGIPVVVAGEAWIRNKGMTKDASSVDHYLNILDQLPVGKRMDDSETRRARKYAFHFFFRRMIEIDCMYPKQGWPPYEVKINSVTDLMMGNDPGLDVICDGILEGTDFILKYENRIESGPSKPLQEVAHAH